MSIILDRIRARRKSLEKHIPLKGPQRIDWRIVDIDGSVLHDVSSPQGPHVGLVTVVSIPTAAFFYGPPIDVTKPSVIGKACQPLYAPPSPEAFSEVEEAYARQAATRAASTPIAATPAAADAPRPGISEADITSYEMMREQGAKLDPWIEQMIERVRKLDHQGAFK